MIKRIKKAAVIFLLVLTSVFSAGCKVWMDRQGFFTEVLLEGAGVSDLPQLPYGQGTHQARENPLILDNMTFYTNMDYDGYMEYVNEVFTYLQNKNFACFGYEKIENEKKYLCESSDLSDYQQEYADGVTYCFLWSDQRGDHIDPTRFAIIYENEKQTTTYTRSVFDSIFGVEYEYHYNVKLNLDDHMGMFAQPYEIG